MSVEDISLQLSPRDIQTALMLTLLVTAALLALVCDIARIQALRRAKRERAGTSPSRMTPRSTLVPR